MRDALRRAAEAEADAERWKSAERLRTKPQKGPCARGPCSIPAVPAGDAVTSVCKHQILGTRGFAALRRAVSACFPHLATLPTGNHRKSPDGYKCQQLFSSCFW